MKAARPRLLQRHPGFGLLMLVAGCLGTAHAAPLDIAAFQYPDGAISVQRKDAAFAPVVDPYFAAKAFLAAMDLGLDVSAPAHAWIGWMLPHQRPDGRLDRWCVKDNTYLHCAQADADDAALAVWMELIYRLYPAGPVPVTWQVSLYNADHYLGSLMAPAGYYHVSQELKVGLLMDNAEVYSALVAASRHAQAAGDDLEAGRNKRRAEQLAQAASGTFWVRAKKRYRPSTQAHRPGSFYPEATAQLYPMLADMPLPEVRVTDWPAWFRSWQSHHEAAWLNNARLDYPWGLVALAAWKAGESDTAACWLKRAASERSGVRWNVLEEAIFQGLTARLGDTPCTRTAD